jgi:hypothetical protein
MLTLKQIENKRQMQTTYLIVQSLASMCAGSPHKIIDLLTGYLWNEEESGGLKRCFTLPEPDIIYPDND